MLAGVHERVVFLLVCDGQDAMGSCCCNVLLPNCRELAPGWGPLKAPPCFTSGTFKGSACLATQHLCGLKGG